MIAFAIESNNARKSFLVAQLGARMHYAVPQILARAGALGQFFTDGGLPGRERLILDTLAGLIPIPGLKRLASRNAPIPDHKITSLNLLGIAYAIRRKRAKTESQRNEAYRWMGEKFCRKVLRHDLSFATGVYVFNTAGLEILEWAHERGLPGFCEQTIAPKRIEHEILSNEHDAWPGWEPDAERGTNFAELADREAQEWAKATAIICGSKFVADGLGRLGVSQDRCRIIPYGFAGAPMNPKKRSDSKLHILFCGAIGLRKGVPYLLKAAKSLPASRFEFRLVGGSNVSAKSRQDLAERCQLVGAVPRSEIRQHLSWAHVLLLPTLCEGSATICYEALAAGVPVITTPNAGSVVRDGIEGYIVAPRDDGAIVERLEELLQNPATLTRLTKAARQRSEEFTVLEYGRRLCEALGVVESHRSGAVI